MNIIKEIDFRQAENSEINMTHRQGSVTSSFQEICAVFGEPHAVGELGDKIDFEWMFVFNDDTVATLYNWKNGVCYCGVHGLATEDITEWNIGGFSADAVHYIQGALNAKKDSQ